MNNMQTVIILKGAPASGKSTKARELCAQGYKRINNDDLRRCVDFSVWSKENEAVIKSSTELLLKDFLKQGHNVVIDNVHAGNQHFDRYARVIGMLHIDCVLEELPIYIDLQEAIARDKWGGNCVPGMNGGWVGPIIEGIPLDRVSVGVEVVTKWWKKLGGESFKTYKPRRLEFKKMEPVVVDKNLPWCVICDIDGTVADCTGVRSPYDGSKVHLDLPVTNIIHLVNTLAEHISIVFCSGREEIHRDATEKWINDNIYYPAFKGYDLFMRPAGDSRPDYIVKRELLENYILPNYCPLFIIDDRKQVVDMWRTSGLTCLQVAPGEF